MLLALTRSAVRATAARRLALPDPQGESRKSPSTAPWRDSLCAAGGARSLPLPLSLGSKPLSIEATTEATPYALRETTPDATPDALREATIPELIAMAEEAKDPRKELDIWRELARKRNLRYQENGGLEEKELWEMAKEQVAALEKQLAAATAPAPPTAENLHETLAALNFTLAETDELRVSTHNNYMAEFLKFQDRAEPLRATFAAWTASAEHRADGNQEPYRHNAHVFTYGPPGTGKSRFLYELCMMSDGDAAKLIASADLRSQFVDGIRIMVSFNDSTDVTKDAKLTLDGEARLALRVLHAVFARNTDLKFFAPAMNARLSLRELELRTALEVVRAAAGDDERPIFLMVDELVRPEKSRKAPVPDRNGNTPLDDTQLIVDALAFQLDSDVGFYHISSSLQAVVHHSGSGRPVKWVNMVALQSIDFVMEALENLELAGWDDAEVQKSVRRLLHDCCGQPRAFEMVYLQARSSFSTDVAQLRWAVIEAIRHRYAPNWKLAQAVFPLVVKQQEVKWGDEITDGITYVKAASAGFLMNTEIPDPEDQSRVIPVVLPLWLLASIPTSSANKPIRFESKQLHHRTTTAIELLFPLREAWQTFEYRASAWCAVRRYMMAMDLGSAEPLDLLSPFRGGDGKGKLLGVHNLDEPAWRVPVPEERMDLLRRINSIASETPVPVDLGSFIMPPDNTQGADAIVVFDGAMVLEQSKFSTKDITLGPGDVRASIRQQTSLLTGSSEPELQEHKELVGDKAVWHFNARVTPPLPAKSGGLLPRPDDDPLQMTVKDKAKDKVRYSGPAAEAAAQLDTSNVLHVVLTNRRVVTKELMPRNVIVVGREELAELQGESLRFREAGPRQGSEEEEEEDDDEEDD